MVLDVQQIQRMTIKTFLILCILSIKHTSELVSSLKLNKKKTNFIHQIPIGIWKLPYRQPCTIKTAITTAHSHTHPFEARTHSHNRPLLHPLHVFIHKPIHMYISHHAKFRSSLAQLVRIVQYQYRLWLSAVVSSTSFQVSLTRSHHISVRRNQVDQKIQKNRNQISSRVLCGIFLYKYYTHTKIGRKKKNNEQRKKKW